MQNLLIAFVGGRSLKQLPFKSLLSKLFLREAPFRTFATAEFKLPEYEKALQYLNSEKHLNKGFVNCVLLSLISYTAVPLLERSLEIYSNIAILETHHFREVCSLPIVSYLQTVDLRNLYTRDHAFKHARTYVSLSLASHRISLPESFGALHSLFHRISFVGSNPTWIISCISESVLFSWFARWPSQREIDNCFLGNGFVSFAPTTKHDLTPEKISFLQPLLLCMECLDCGMLELMYHPMI